MNKMIRTLMTLAALAVGSTALQAQPALKLIVVDMAKVFDAHYKSEEANAKFREVEQKGPGSSRRRSASRARPSSSEYKELDEQAKNALLTPEARAKGRGRRPCRRAQEIQRKQADLQSFLQNTERSLQQRIKTHRDLLLEEISKTVADMAKKQGATLVLDKSGPTLFGIPAIIYADPAYDITADVITEVNKDRPAPRLHRRPPPCGSGRSAPRPPPRRRRPSPC